MNYILEASRLNKTIGLEKNAQQQILKNINLQIEHGEFIAIMGPSGSGKSTLLYNMSGMDRCTAGSVLFKKSEITMLSEKSLAALRLTQMGFIFQQILLLKNLNIFDNIVLSGYLAKLQSKQNVNERAQELMEKMGIAQLKHNSLNQASGGQLQRAAICRALINNPDILFGDEPTGALNSSAAEAIMAIFADINRLGTTIVLVTHDSKVAAKADRIIYIFDGEIRSEKRLGKYLGADSVREREAMVTDWLRTMDF